MQYSSFSSTDSIRTKEDLRDFFISVDKTCEDKGRKKIFWGNKLFRERMVDGFMSLQRRGLVAKRRTPREIKPLPKGIKLQDAGRDMIWQAPGGLELVKTGFTVKGKARTAWRNRKTGRFAKAPES